MKRFLFFVAFKKPAQKKIMNSKSVIIFMDKNELKKRSHRERLNHLENESCSGTFFIRPQFRLTHLSTAFFARKS